MAQGLLVYFSSKTAGLIEPKVHLQPLWDRGIKVCERDLGHLTNIAPMPIYGKFL